MPSTRSCASTAAGRGCSTITCSGCGGASSRSGWRGAASNRRPPGCLEALFYLPDGTLTEGTHTNLFGVRDGRLVTAPRNNEILPGITRGFLVGLARQAGVAVEERKLHRDRLEEVAELFVSGTTSE